MSKVITFSDKSTLEFTDESTVTNLVTVVTGYDKVEAIRSKFTVSALASGMFDGKNFVNLAPVCVDAHADVGGNVVVTVTNRSLSSDELQDLALTEIYEKLLA